ncbi:MAG TPA: alkaline phosphatase family protein [Ktedonobacterales bacterium]|nr:alkaline phosphatase family protein [Ktedonobacterales bacterium]
MRWHRPRFAPTIVALLAALAIIPTALAMGAQSTARTDHPAASLPEFDHVFIIMMENHSTADIIGDPNAAYINSLARTYGQATNYFGVTHPSFPNYLAATSGNNWYYNSDTTAGQLFDHTNIVDQVQASGRTWKAYMDSMPAGQPLADNANGGRYVVKHDPFIMYADVRNNPERAQNIVPLTQLSTDLSSGDLPNYVWITPDQCDDMHGIGGVNSPCPFANKQGDQNDQNLIKDGDTFVQTWVTAIQHSRSWTKRSVIFLTWDENDFAPIPSQDNYINDNGCCDSPILPAGSILNTGGVWPGGVLGGGSVAMIVIGDSVKHGFSSNVAYNHYSMLRTIEDAWHMGYIGMASDAQQVHSMSEFFKH